MDAYQYLIVMAACVAVTLPLEWLLGARVYRRWRLLLPTLGVVLVVFVAWDVLAILREHWTFSPRFTTGVLIGPVPIEEIVFFVVIPLAGLLSYEGVDRVLSWLRDRRRPATPGTEGTGR